ncbi:hypothetical protein PAGA_a0802 [Pseudoalteromonas agarivorans DSM 14585]|uniref:Uncharacterized protein n=1 Tax=Pseudoalteromonas agarivorans DSM 14585 TaxID=1312369 RepID=A0ACA8DT77_9GAMM|nr:hypothetical protein PAGA_a0802 [Pseudoalteromonas agarivorans DSM 14585]
MPWLAYKHHEKTAPARRLISPHLATYSFKPSVYFKRAIAK